MIFTNWQKTKGRNVERELQIISFLCQWNPLETASDQASKFNKDF